MKLSLSHPASLLVLLLAAAAAQAQTVWRCGPDGRTYSDSPCADGRMVAVADARAPAEVTDARAVLARDQRLARQLVAERLAREREAKAQGSGLAGIRTGDGVRPTASAMPAKAATERQRRPMAKPRRAAEAETSRAAGPGSRQRPG